MSLSTFPIARPSASMSCSPNAPTNRPSRDLSTARMCSVRALAFAPMDGMATSSGKRSSAGVVVKGTTTTVPRRWLMRVSETMAHGRVWACSWPYAGSRWVQYTSPRWCVGVMLFPQVFLQTAGVSHSVRLGQLQLRGKTLLHQSQNPTLLKIRLGLPPANFGFRPPVAHFVSQGRSCHRGPPPMCRLLCPAHGVPDRPKIRFAAVKEPYALSGWLRLQVSAAATIWA